MSLSAEKARTLRFFQSVPQSTLEKALNLNEIFLRFYTKGQTIYYENDCCQTLDILLSGQISIVKYDIQGNVFNVANIQKGQIISGNLLFSSHHRYPFNLVAAEDTELIRLTKEAALDLMQSDRYALLEILKELSEKTLLLATSVHTLSEKSIRQKILLFLQAEAHRQNSQTIELTFSKKNMAERFGIARTSLSRELRNMEKEGLIRFSAKSITLI